MKDLAPGTLRSPLGTGFRWDGLFLSTDVSDSMWIRERGLVLLPCALDHDALVIEGELRPDNGVAAAAGTPGLALRLNGRRIAEFFPPVGPFSWRVPVPAALRNRTPLRIELRLRGVWWTNLLAFLGRVCEGRAFAARLQPYRLQPGNKRLRIRRLAAGDETIVDFRASATAFDIGFITRHARIGMNLVGWFRAELGVGESVRCAARAAAAAAIPHALVPLKLYCKAAQGDLQFESQLREQPVFPVNVIHVDAPQTRDIDYHHGRAFRRGRYNIGYWAWELPEFPDGWVRYAEYVDEIWAPSRFTREAIAAKVGVPVLAMPHAIDFTVPETPDPRRAFGLPANRFLFLFMYDLNSYQARKNPQAVLRAFRRAFGAAGRDDVGLVIKVHGIRGNEADLAHLRAAVADVNGCTLLTETLPRDRVYLLEQACDCFISLHRSEGFGLALAEAMFLGKPVISTDWSGTAEFINAANGCPVNYSLIELAENHGPYTKGQRWAEPDIEHAAWHMQRLFDDRALGAQLGAAAAATIRHEFSPATIGALYAARLRAMALW